MPRCKQFRCSRVLFGGEGGGWGVSKLVLTRKIGVQRVTVFVSLCDSSAVADSPDFSGLTPLFQVGVAAGPRCPPLTAMPWRILNLRNPGLPRKQDAVERKVIHYDGVLPRPNSGRDVFPPRQPAAGNRRFSLGRRIFVDRYPGVRSLFAALTSHFPWADIARPVGPVEPPK